MESISASPESQDSTSWQVRHLVNGLHAIVWEASAQTWQFSFVSEEAEAMLGYAVEDWLADPEFWISHIHPDDREQSVRYCKECTDKGIDHQFDYRMRRASGGYLWLRDIVRVVKDERGRAQAVRGVMIDIDAQKRAEEALRESEAQRRRAEEFALIMSVHVGLNGRWLKVPSRLCEFLGYSEADLLGRPCSEVTHPDDRAEDARQVRKLLAGEIKSFDREKRYVRRDGQTVWAYINCSIVTDSEGEPVHFLTYIRDVTAETQAAAELKQSEHRFRTLVQSVPICIHEIDANGCLTSMNPAGLRMVKATDESQIRGGSYLDFVCEEDRPQITHLMSEAFQGRAAAFQFSACVGGQTRVFSSSFIPVLDAEGNVTQLTGATQDITHRFQMNQQLLASERSLAKSQQIAKLGNWEFDIATGEVSGSAETYRILGRADCEFQNTSVDELIGQLIHHDDQQYVRGMLQTLVTHGCREPVEFRHVTNEGDTKYLRAEAELIRDPGDRPTTIFGTLLDITAQKETELALRESESKFRVICENYPAMVAIFQDGVVKYANEKVAQILEYSKDELVGTDFEKLVDSEDRQVVRERNRSRTQGEAVPSRYDLKLRTKHGAVRYIDFKAGYVEYGGQPAVIGVGLDVTKRRAVEAKLQQRDAELAHISRLATMGEMVAGIAHEVTQPLSAIANFADACTIELNKLDNEEFDRIKQWTQQIGQQAIRCGDIIRRLRGFVQQPKTPQRGINVNEVILESIGLLRHKARHNVVDVDCQLSSPSPTVFGSPVELQQVIVNLLTNAYDALNQVSHDERRVIVHSRRNAGVVEMVVEDTGIGMTDGDLDSIFEPFYSTKASGMGMGLAISRSIVERHKGRLWAEHNQPHGAVFHIELPITKD